MDIYNELVSLSKKSLDSKDVPIGALIIRNNEVIGIGFNTREKDQNVLGHAEINAIIDAQKNLGNWNLNGSVLYVTLKPCSMCMEVIKQARIDKVYYILDKYDFKKEYDKTEVIKLDVGEEEILEILRDFFKKLREK